MAADGFDFSAQTAATAVEAQGRIEAVAFSGHFGALHLPAPTVARGVTVLVCPPVGRDARCAYRALFHLAQILAAQGFAVLRYDPLASGDSSPLPAEADHWRGWTEGVEQAAAFARAHGGGARLVLAGLRIGASLAAEAAQRIQPDALMLLAPIASGPAWIRELRMSAAMVGAPRTDDGSIELDGLRLNRATIEALEACDLRRLAVPSIPVFLAAPAPDPRLAASLGPQLTTAPFEGYARLFREAHLNEPPAELFAEAAAWLAALPAGAPLPAPPPPPATLTGAAWTEQAVCFGPGLRGVLTLPAGARGREAVIFGNTGADPRYGIGSFAAEAARALAREGMASLRFDFSGFGESQAREPGQWRPHVYLTSRLDDFHAAADVLAERGFTDLTLAGVCAGGHQALRAAIADGRFRRVLAINTLLVWRPLQSLESRPAKAGARRRVNLLALLRPSSWRRLIGGEVRAGEALTLLIATLRRHYSARRIDAACAEVRNGVAAMAGRGVRVRLVVGRDDDALEALEADFGPSGAWLARQEGVDVVIQRDLDHGLFSPHCRLRMIEELKTFARSPAKAPRRRIGAAAWVGGFKVPALLRGGSVPACLGRRRIRRQDHRPAVDPHATPAPRAPASETSVAW